VRPPPPVNIVTPRAAGPAALEPDDLPPPQLEVVERAAAVELPAIPALQSRPGEPGRPVRRDAVITAVVTVPPLRKAVDEELRDLSVRHLNACNQAIAARRFDAAIAACQAAIAAWDGNHLAWYARASAHLAQGAWRDALTAIEHAVTLRPDLAMYQLYHGIALYETAHLHAGKRRDEVASGDAVATARLRLATANGALLRAATLEPALWRAHYYLGRIYRELDETRRAADQLTQAIQRHPGHRASYVALSELYRRERHVEQALAVATLGTQHVPAADAGDLWFEIALAYAEKPVDDDAIVALGRAIAATPSDANPKLVRGWLYARKGDLAHARRDLDEAARSTDPKAATARQLAQQLLAQLAGRSAPDASGQTSCTATNLCQILAAPRSGWGGTDPITRL
jgi:tetratricopeptide (TPR) repeat protein